jgi:hypothetical protein
MQSIRTARVAIWLWVTLAVFVFAVVFDHVIVTAGREYITAANRSVLAGGPYEPVGAWMQPAVRRGLATAAALGASILLCGLLLVEVASRRARNHARTRDLE